MNLILQVLWKFGCIKRVFVRGKRHVFDVDICMKQALKKLLTGKTTTVYSGINGFRCKEQNSHRLLNRMNFFQASVLNTGESLAAECMSHIATGASTMEENHMPKKGEMVPDFANPSPMVIKTK